MHNSTLLFIEFKSTFEVLTGEMDTFAISVHSEDQHLNGLHVSEKTNTFNLLILLPGCLYPYSIYLVDLPSNGFE